MKFVARLLPTIAAALAGVAATAAVASAAPPAHPVFVQTDDPAGNHIVVYDRASDGTLTQAGSYATGGLGGVLKGSVVDHLASQGSLAYDAAHQLLYAVNAGSGTISVFGVDGDSLRLLQITSSRGSFPVSLAVHGDLVYVLNAKRGGSVHGFAVSFGRLSSLPSSTRRLGLDPTAAPQFVNTPGQVAFSPDGSRVLVTTKANGEDVDVFKVNGFGLLSASPVANHEPGTVPFALGFDQAGHLLVAEAGTNALQSFTLNADRTITPIAAVPTGQAATCWIVAAGPFQYVSNAGSGSLSGFDTDGLGHLTLLGATATDPGTVDAAATPDGRFLYVQAGGPGNVDEFTVGADGSLTRIGTVTVPGAVGGEGIAVS